jgi:tetratricopeptide (TPR) repeat protein
MNGLAAMADLSTVETEVFRLRRLQSEGRHEAALAGARAMLVDWPRNRDLLLVQALSLRHLSRLDEALASLALLESLQPKFSLLHQERGLCFVARRDAPQAIDALLRAVNINPALPMAW